MAFLNPSQILQRAGLKPGQTVADLGCGHGFITLEAAKKVGETGKVFAVDVQKNALSAVRDKAKMENLDSIIKFVWADIEILGSTKIKAGSCDLVVLSDVLFQADDLEKMVQEAQRIMKKDGKIVMIDWKKEEKIDGGPPFNLRVDLDQLKGIIVRLGMVIKEEFEASSFHWGLVVEE